MVEFDDMSLESIKKAVKRKFGKELRVEKENFSLLVQKKSIDEVGIEILGENETYKKAGAHYNVIRIFGNYGGVNNEVYIGDSIPKLKEAIKIYEDTFNK